MGLLMVLLIVWWSKYYEVKDRLFVNLCKVLEKWVDNDITPKGIYQNKIYTNLVLKTNKDGMLEDS